VKNFFCAYPISSSFIKFLDCKNGYSGEKCEICSEGWYRPENKTENECTYCGCNPDGSEGKCDQTGHCKCRKGYTGPKCNECADTYFRSGTKCKRCGCDPYGSKDGSEGKCDQTGQCQCKIGFQGKMCNECKDGFTGRNCDPCECNENGAASPICDKSDGKCQCKDGFKGHKCNGCSSGFHSLLGLESTCENCNCDAIGSKFNFCSQSGQCECKKGYSGEKCDKCAKRFYRPGNKTENECTYCDCNPDGVTRTSDGNCDANGKCDCLKDNSGKDLFEGKQCHEKVFQCRSSRAWKCKGIDKCIYKDYLCDGDNDCGNNSDENCACTPNEGRCLHGSGYGMGQCTPNRKWCYCTDCTSASDTAISVFTFGLWEARSDWSQCKCSFLG